MRFIRELIYKRGFRPKLGSIFFSPSLDLSYKIRDDLSKSYRKHMDEVIDKMFADGAEEPKGILDILRREDAS